MRGRKVRYRYQDIVHQVEQLALIKLNWTKIAQTLGVNIRTLDRYKKLHPELSRAYEEGKTRGESSLKGKAFQMAMAGDTTMLKHCLRNITDWQEKDSEINVHQTTVVNNANKLTDEQRAKQSELVGRFGKFFKV